VLFRDAAVLLYGEISLTVSGVVWVGCLRWPPREADLAQSGPPLTFTRLAALFADGPFLRSPTVLAIGDQERAGLDIITDGEVRRESDSNRFATAVEGIDIDNPGTALYACNCAERMMRNAPPA